MGLAACAAKRPVLYPNAQMQRVGDIQAQQDVDECIELASSHGHGADQVGRAGARTGEGAVVGAATGAAAGAVLGNAARGTATGAAAGGARSLVRGLFAWREPDPIERGFVQECLRERGYRVIGWD
jgi:outer membrane lipoprotein SlyB